MELTKKQILDRYEYDRENGTLIHRKTRKDTVPNNKGYKILGYNDGEKTYFKFVHRLIFFLEHGYYPKLVDHIDRNKLNNHYSNLRECTHQENLLNQGGRNTVSGHKGINKCPNGKWRVRKQIDGKLTHMGVFETLEEAINCGFTNESAPNKGTIKNTNANEPNKSGLQKLIDKYE